GGDHLITGFEGRLQADDDRFLADVEVAKTANQTHAVELACALFEAADEQHVAIKAEQVVLARFRCVNAVAIGALSGLRHACPPPRKVRVWRALSTCGGAPLLCGNGGARQQALRSWRCQRWGWSRAKTTSFGSPAASS